MASTGALDLIATVVDHGSWRPWDEPLRDAPPDPSDTQTSDAQTSDDRTRYAQRLAEARSRTGLDEAVVTGEGRIRGRRVAIVACEFGFLAGSIGVAAADRLVRAVERATAERLALLASPTSGGTRMQEGTVAFIQMIKISSAVAQHKARGNPYLVYLRGPTTGGVFASWGSLGHITVAEPGALIAFLGPRVYDALNPGVGFPPDVQTAENLFAHGIVDAVLPPTEIADVLDRALAVLTPQRNQAEPPPPPEESPPEGPLAVVPVWESITRSRRADRPRVRQFLRQAATDVIPLSGTGAGEIDAGMLLALARFGRAGCVVLGQVHRPGGPALGPAGLREARRGMQLAAELDLPLVTVVDTAGVALSREAEEGGLAGEIARCLAELVLLPAPTVCLLLGEGAGGGALALLPADRVVAAQHAWLAPLPPEGAAAIMYRTTARADEAAVAQGVGSSDLVSAGIVDRIVPERPDAADEPRTFLARLGRVLEEEITRLVGRDPATRLASRLHRYRRLGTPEDR